MLFRSITGVSATGAVGSVGVLFEVTPAGVEALGEAGDLTNSRVLDPLTGVSTTLEPGTVTPNHIKFATGVQAVGLVATMQPSSGILLTPVVAIGRVGDFGYSGWTTILNPQEANWQTGQPPPGVNWQSIQSAQEASWQAIQTAQSSSWVLIENEQEGSWDVVVTE